MSDDELNSHIKLVRKLRGEAFITGRQQKQAKSIASGGKEAKELSDMANALGLTPDELFAALMEVFEGEV